MSFGNITDLPTLTTYEQALKYYDSIKPIRGSDNFRPLCMGSNGRKKKSYRIVATVIDGHQAIACRFYDTDVVRFLKNGEIQIAIEGWNSSSTMSFIDGVLSRRWSEGLCLAACIRSGKTLISYMTPVGDSYHEHHSRMPDDNEPLRFTADDEGYVTVLNRPKSTRHYVDRSKMTEVRSRNKEFLAYVRRMWKVMDTSVESLKSLRADHLWSDGGFAREQLESNDMAQWNALAQGIYAESIKDTYQSGTYRYVLTLTLDNINKTISRLLRDTYEDEVVFEKEIDPTVMPD